MAYKTYITAIFTPLVLKLYKNKIFDVHLKQGWGACRPRTKCDLREHFDMARIRIFVTQVRVLHSVKTKVHEK